jgi:hypothetical protein
MEVCAYDFICSSKGSSFINPVVSMLLHAAHARVMGSATTFNSFEFVLGIKTSVFGVC